VLLPHPNAREVSRWVARLPMDYFVCRLTDHWTVVGPTGIFVVGSSGDDPLFAAETTISLAHRIRTLLSDLIPWVPFVDALLVGGEDHPGLPCTVIDGASLEMALLSGPLSIDEAGMSELRRSVPTVLSAIDSSADVVTTVAPDELRRLDPA
jgi:hypothetical protein